MPLTGVKDLTPQAAGAPEMPSLDTDVMVAERSTVVQVMMEIQSAIVLDLLPPALQPTIPATVTFVFYDCADAPIGGFRLAQARIGCRAGVRPRGFVLGAVVDDGGSGAGAELAARWGFPVRNGSVAVKRYHDRVDCRASLDGRPVLAVSVVDPEPINGGDVQYVASMHLARTPRGPRLVQVDPEFTFHRADRGRPEVAHFDAASFGEPGIDLTWPVSASVTVADITFPKLRYVSRLDVPALQGTERL